jgi:hypothetical protein
MSERELLTVHAAACRDRLLRAAMLVLQAELGSPANADDAVAEVDFEIAAEEEFTVSARAYVEALEA